MSVFEIAKLAPRDVLSVLAMAWVVRSVVMTLSLTRPSSAKGLAKHLAQLAQQLILLSATHVSSDTHSQVTHVSLIPVAILEEIA